MNLFFSKIFPVSKNQFCKEMKQIKEQLNTSIENVSNINAQVDELKNVWEQNINFQLSELKKMCEQIILQQDKLQIQLTDYIKLNLNKSDQSK